MLNYLTLILLCQLAGELLVLAAGAPLPGPVVGMVLLFGFLLWRGHVPDALANVGDTLLRNLSLLFVPAGVGIMLHFSLIGDDWLALGVALIASTVLTVCVTAWIMVWLSRKSTGPKPEPNHD